MTNRPHRARTSLLGVAGCFLALALGATSANAAESPYELNVLLPLTGPGAFIGQAGKQDLELIQAMVNKSGGIKGHPLHFVLADDQANPQVAVQLTSGLIAKNVPVILGGVLANTCLAMVPLLAKSGPVQYCLSPGLHPKHGGYIFSAGVGVLDDAIGTVRFFREKGWTRVAIITATDAIGQEMDRSFASSLALPENHGMHVVATEHFNPSDISVAAQVARVKTANPQAILSWVTGTPFGTLLRGLHDGGVDLPISSSTGNMSFAQMAQYTSFLPKELLFPGFAYVASEPTPGMTPQQRDFIAAMKSAGIKPDFQSGMPWDPAMIVIDALRHVGADAPADKIRAYMAALHGYQGITGPYDFRDGTNRGLNEKGVVVMRWDGAKTMWTAVSHPGGMPL